MAALAVALLLVGCSAGSDEAEPEPTAETTAEPSTTETSEEPTTAEPTEEPAASVVPDQCLAATSSGTAGDPIAEAAATAALPQGVTLQIGTQVLTSIEEQGGFEAVSRICSMPLTESEHRTIATEIARAIYMSGAGESLVSLHVTSWVPDGDTVTDAGSLRVDDYAVVLWDSETANLDAMWKTSDEE